MVANFWQQSSWVRLSGKHNFSTLPSWFHLYLFGLVFCMFDTFSGLSPLMDFFCHSTMCHRVQDQTVSYSVTSMMSSVMPAMSGYINVLYVCYIASTKIYSMESPIDTARPPTVWDLHISTIKRAHSCLPNCRI